MSPSQPNLTQTLVDLSDTLVADFDVVDFLHVLSTRCVELLAVQAAGIMIADQRGALRVMASSSEQARLLELFEVETDEGPCVDCYLSATAVADPDLGTPNPRWRRFAARAREAGFRAVHAVPLRLRDEVVGVLNLFAEATGPLGGNDARTARALANVATLGLLQHRAVEYRQVLAEQVQQAMNSRVTIEQAKGVLAEYLDLDMAAAFAELRRYAKRAGQRLSDVALAVTATGFAPRDPSDRGALRVLLIRRFDDGALARLRAAVRDATREHGLTDQQTAAFVLAVHEAAANVVRHGGGAGQLLLWRRADDLLAEVSDRGGGLPEGLELAAQPGSSIDDHRGLWLINEVCASVDVSTGATGTRLLLRYPLDSAAGPEPAATDGPAGE